MKTENVLGAQLFCIADIDAASYARLTQLRLGTKEDLNRVKSETPGKLIMTSGFSQVCRAVLFCCWS